MSNTQKLYSRADAQRNRATLLTAAREVFAEKGIDASLSLVVKRSGLGRGSLYRHFPNRLVLVSAIFDENFEELESLSTKLQGQPKRFQRVFWLLIEQLMAARGFITVLLNENSAHLPFQNHQDRLRELLTNITNEAHQLNQLPGTIQVPELSLAVNLLAGLVSHHPQEGLEEVVTRSITLMGLADYVLH